MTAKSHYDQTVASKYDQLRSWGREPGPEGVARIAALGPVSRVLDVGCGTGNFGMAVQAIAGGVFTGVDYSHEMIRRALDKAPRIRFALGDASALPFGDASFDAVVGSFFLHHVSTDRRPLVARECYRVLERGTVAFVTSSHQQIESSFLGRFFPEYVAIDAARFPKVEEILGWFDAAGFGEAGEVELEGHERHVNMDYVDWVARKPISTLDLIEPGAFANGMRRLREYVAGLGGRDEAIGRFFSVVWATKAE